MGFFIHKTSFGKKTGLRFGTFSINNLERAIATLHGERVIRESQGKQDFEVSISRKEFGLEKYAGQLKEVIVLVGDFCSYSKFLLASGEDRDLVTSIMGRFYRESREIIHSYGGILDKFIGDGFLAYWFIDKDDNYIKSQFEQCTRELIGFAVYLANEWQEHIDYSVEPKGLMAGATIGQILFIPEDAHGISYIHAIGDSINLAERLQSVAYPNILVISNKLRKRFFESDESYEELPPKTLKNIGDILAWKKPYE